MVGAGPSLLSTGAEQGADDRKRAERWARAIVAVLAIASVAPISIWLADRGSVADPIRERLSRFSELSGSEDVHLEDGAAFLGVAVMAVGWGGFAVIAQLRRRRSARYVRDSIATGGAGPSPAVPYTVAAWVVLLGFATIAGLVLAVAGGENTSDVTAHFADQPLWMLLVVPGAAVAILLSQYMHRSHHELPPLISAGVRDSRPHRLRPGRSDRPGITDAEPRWWSGFVEGLRTFAAAAAIQLMFALAGLIDGYLGSRPAPGFGDGIANAVMGLLFGAAVFNGVFLLIFFAFAATRWLVRDALAEPATRAAIGLCAGALVLSGVGVAGWIPSAMIVVGAVIACATGLYVEDKGPQPWLGLLFITLAGLAGVATAADGSGGVLPETVIGWVVYLGGVAVAGVSLAEHWRRHMPSSGRRHHADATTTN